jgi:hypothetical protein
MNPIEIIKELETKALAGDSTAAEHLFAIAFDSVHSLRTVALKDPKPLLRVTRLSAFLPAMICPNKSKDSEHKHLLDILEVGKAGMFNENSTQAMSLDSPAKGTAATLYAEMRKIRAGRSTSPSPDFDQRCKALPEPCRETFGVWDKMMREFLPGSDNMDCYPAEKWPEIMRQPITDGQKVDAIKKAISQAFYTLLPIR